MSERDGLFCCFGDFLLDTLSGQGRIRDRVLEGPLILQCNLQVISIQFWHSVYKIFVIVAMSSTSSSFHSASLAAFVPSPRTF